jgi:hypothetical protein
MHHTHIDHGTAGDLVACLDYSYLPGHTGGGPVERSATLISPDHGATWFVGATNITGDECAIAELENGTVEHSLYTILIHYTHTLYSYTILIHYTHTLYSLRHLLQSHLRPSPPDHLPVLPTIEFVRHRR